jgi:rhomboid protease GluP
MFVTSPDRAMMATLSEPERQEPAPDAAPAHPKAIEAHANAAFMARLNEVTPRIGVVAAIVAANLAIFVAMTVAGVSATSPKVADLLRWGGNYGPRTLGGQPWRIVTAAFVHAGFLHVAMNMFALWSSGRVIERIFGGVRFAAIYLCAAVAGGIASVAMHPQIVSVGASGAVFGIYGALAAFLLREHGGIPVPVLRRLGRVAATFVIYNIIFGFTQPAIDNAAHVGGLCGGVLAGAWLARPLVVDRPAAPARILAALAIAAVTLVAVTRALPTTPDLDAALNQFATTETRAIGAYNSLVERAHKGEIDDPTFAAGIEHDVLPPWRAARAALMAPQRWTPEQRAVLDRLERYNDARERSWVLLVRTARTQSPDDRAAAKEAQAEAKRLLGEIRAGR